MRAFVQALRRVSEPVVALTPAVPNTLSQDHSLTGSDVLVKQRLGKQ